jgi:hypothetical protein
MCLGQKAQQPLAIYHPTPVLHGNQVLLGETRQMFCDARPGGSNQPSQIFMPQGQGQSHSAIIAGSAEIFSQIEQNKREAFFKRTAY